ncbi:MAG: hypothetical protein HN919_16040 [Verrucomicrobia bacterium]|nr:hypothetical protein [Verrucomicrobiota bacterium]MBT7699337.1 hypothetical protein [Verrucomicrobiota bacterium]
MQDYSRDGGRRRSVILYVIAAIAFLLLALVWTRPLHRYLFKGIPYEVEPHAGIEVVHVSPQDCLQLYYKYWLFSEFVAGRIPVFSDPYEFALPGARGFTSQQFPVSLIFAALRPISPIFAYNAIILLSFLGCGLFMMMLVRCTMDDWWAAALAGLIFCIMPFRLPQLMAGHPNGVVVMLLPLVLYFAHRGLEGKRAAAIGAGLTATAIALMDMQLAYFSAMLITAFVLWRTCGYIVVHWRPVGPRIVAKLLLPRLLLMGVSALPGVIYLIFVKRVVLKASAIHGSGVAGSGQIGPALKDIWDITVCGERRIYMGPYVLAFAVAGLILPYLLKHKRVVRWRADAIFWLLMVVGGIVLSLSLNPPFNRWVDGIPIARLSRTPARAAVITFTGLALLAAQALSVLRGWLQRWRNGRAIGAAVAVACMALVVADYWLEGPRGINVLAVPSPVYQNITASTDDPRVLAVPIWPGDSSMSSSLFHHIARSRVHLINGYSPVASADYRAKVFEPFSLANVGQFGSNEWALAQAMGVTHVTFHPESFPAPGHVSVFPADLTLDRLKQTPGLTWLEHHDPVDGFRLQDAPEWSTAPPRAISPVSYNVSGYHCGMPGETALESPPSIAGHIQTGSGGTTNAVFQWRGRVLPSGAYTVGLRMRVMPMGDSMPTPVRWNVEAVDSLTSNVLTTAAFPDGVAEAGEFEWFSLPLSLDTARRVGLRLTSPDRVRFELDLWTIGFSAARNQMAWEAEDFYHAGRTLAVEGAGGRGVVNLGANDPTEGVIRGPFKYIPAGDYALTVRYRGRSDDAGPVARILLASHLSPAHRHKVDLGALDLSVGGDAQQWREATLPFTVPSSGVIFECCIDRLPGGLIEVDHFRLASK